MNDLREKVIADLDELRIFADTDVHPIVSPDNWNVYAELCDMIDKSKDDVVSLLKAQGEVIDALLKVSYPHNFQREPRWIVNYMYAITDVIKKAVNLRNEVSTIPEEKV